MFYKFFFIMFFLWKSIDSLPTLRLRRTVTRLTVSRAWLFVPGRHILFFNIFTIVCLLFLGLLLVVRVLFIIAMSFVFVVQRQPNTK